jgi:hypothetical protein
MNGAATAAAWVLAAVLAWAAVAKALRRDETATSFAALALPRPETLAVVVPAAEVGVVVALVISPAVGGTLALALLLAFSIVIVRALRAGVTAPCACFGARRGDGLSPWDVLRNGMLMALAAIATATVAPVQPSIATFGAVAAIAALAAIVLRHLRHGAAARP